MRDELEALLEDEEELEAELAGLLASRVVIYRRRDRKDAGAPEREESRTRQDGEPEGEIGRTEGEREILPGPGERLPAAESLYVNLARVRQAAHYRRPEGRRWAPPERQIALPDPLPVDPAELDKAFQRDARRYDGGFAWQ